MVLSEADKKILNAICGIGRDNISMKEIADRLGITYSYMMRRKSQIAHNNGYATTLGMMIDFVKEKAKGDAD